MLPFRIQFDYQMQRPRVLAVSLVGDDLGGLLNPEHPLRGLAVALFVESIE
jgi:hypothetical protein